MTRICYGQGLYNHDIKKHAKEFLSVLPRDVNHLATIGSSGCAIASAMLTVSRRNLKHIHYRKDGESAHTSSCIAPYISDHAPKGTKVAIVDDFFETEKTIYNLIRRVKADGLSLQIIIVSHINRHLPIERHLNYARQNNLVDIEDLSL